MIKEDEIDSSYILKPHQIENIQEKILSMMEVNFSCNDVSEWFDTEGAELFLDLVLHSIAYRKEADKLGNRLLTIVKLFQSIKEEISLYVYNRTLDAITCSYCGASAKDRDTIIHTNKCKIQHLNHLIKLTTTDVELELDRIKLNANKDLIKSILKRKAKRKTKLV